MVLRDRGDGLVDFQIPDHSYLKGTVRKLRREPSFHLVECARKHDVLLGQSKSRVAARKQAGDFRRERPIGRVCKGNVELLETFPRLAQCLRPIARVGELSRQD